MRLPFLFSLSAFLILVNGNIAQEAPVSSSSKPEASKPDKPEEVVVVDLGLRPTATELFKQATEQQKQKQYASALQLFSDLIQFYPDDVQVSDALFHIAECYYALGRPSDVMQALKTLREKFPQSKWKYAADLLQGEMLAADQNWKEALPPLERAVSSQDQAVELRARYILALAHEQLKQLSQARSHLERLVTVSKENSFLNFAHIKLGILELEENHPDLALKAWKQVVENSKEPSARAEAAVRSANLLYSQQKYPEALGFYEVVRRSEAPATWKQLAHFGLLQSHFANKNYTSFISAYQDLQPAFPAQAISQVRFLLAESYRLTGKPKEAFGQYESLLKDFPKDPLAEASSWARLLLFQSGKDERFEKELSAFLVTYPNSSRTPLAKLMQADLAFDRASFEEAVALYNQASQAIDFKTLPPQMHASLLLRWGKALFSLKDFPAAIGVFNAFLSQLPKHEQASQVLWLLAQAQQEAKNPEEALVSLQKLLDAFPGFDQRETVLWQAAVLAQNQKKYDKAANYTQQLLDKFPKSRWFPDACYVLALSLTEQKKMPEAKPWWRKARELNPQGYTEVATRYLIQTALVERNLKELIEEVAQYDAWAGQRSAAPPLSVDILEWIGRELVKTSRFVEAEPYYQRSLSITQNDAQRKRIFLALAQIKMELKQWSEAVEQWKIFRINYPDDANRSLILEPLTQACIRAGNFDEALAYTEQILRQNPEGEWNARARILLGDIAFAKQQYEEAAKIYSAVALLIEDPVLTPLAKSKAQEARSMIQTPPR